LIFLVDKETQIKILLYGNPLDFACETLGVKNMRYHNYSKVFTVIYVELMNTDTAYAFYKGFWEATEKALVLEMN